MYHICVYVKNISLNPMTCPVNTMVHREGENISTCIQCHLEEFFINSIIGD